MGLALAKNRRETRGDWWHQKRQPGTREITQTEDEGKIEMVQARQACSKKVKGGQEKRHYVKKQVVQGHPVGKKKGVCKFLLPATHPAHHCTRTTRNPSASTDRTDGQQGGPRRKMHLKLRMRANPVRLKSLEAHRPGKAKALWLLPSNWQKHGQNQGN